MAERYGDEEIKRLNALLGAEFRSTRQARRWRSQTIVCRRSGLKRGVISKIEHGEPARLYHYQTYAAALGMRLGLVPDDKDDLADRTSEDAAVTRVTSRALSVILELDRYREDVVDRRQLIVSLAALLLDSAAPRSLRLLFTAKTLPVSNASDVEALGADCGHYFLEHRAAAGGGSVCDVAVGMYQQASSWLEQGGQSPAMNQALQYLRCELGAWAGWLTLDAGRLELANRYLEKTLVHSRLSGCLGTEARALDNLAELLTLRGQLEQSMQAAQLGLQVAMRMNAPRVQALFHLRSAKGSAELGDCEGFRAQAEAAQNALEASKGSPAPLWLDFLTTGACFLGDGHLALGQAEQAVAAFHSIAADRSSNQHCDVVHALVREAQALALMGDTSHAGESGLAALVHAAELSSELISRDLRALRATLTQQVPAPSKARQFVAAYDELIAARA